MVGRVQGGDRFTDRQQQGRLMEVLVRTEALHGWPTRAMQEQLRETWGWSDGTVV